MTERGASKPKALIELSPSDVEVVMSEYEEETGKSADAMSGDEFARRMMDRMFSNALLAQ